VDVRLPQLGMTMHEGTIVRWLKQIGDRVVEGEPLAEIETDKVTVEVTAPGSGVLSSIEAEPGVTVPVLTRIAVID
jgi:pyruvate/2-oxoglutarate dehydrogenase complex dihydrolipoamide acyltransferase (E2) component